MFLIKGSFGNVKAVWKAHHDFNKSLKSLKEKRFRNKELTVTYPGKLILNKSIIFEFYVNRKKTFNVLYAQK